VNNAVFFPDLFWELVIEGGFSDLVLEFGSEEDGEGFDVEEEILFCGKPTCMIVTESTSWDEVMDVRVVTDLSVPCVQDTDHS
jgi:hypothetical protein